MEDNVISRLSVRSDLIEEAAGLLTSAAKFSIDNKKGKISAEELKPRLQAVKQHAAKFREANK